MFKLAFTTGNSAFATDTGGGALECARILAALAKDIQDQGGMTPGYHGLNGALRDINGNRVGEWVYTAE